MGELHFPMEQGETVHTNLSQISELSQVYGVVAHTGRTQEVECET